jgi:hypothetical protein
VATETGRGEWWEKLYLKRGKKMFSFACYLSQASFLFDLSFDPEDGGDMSLRNVGWFPTDYTVLYPRRTSEIFPALMFSRQCPLVRLV